MCQHLTTEVGLPSKAEGRWVVLHLLWTPLPPQKLYGYQQFNQELRQPMRSKVMEAVAMRSLNAKDHEALKVRRRCKWGRAKGSALCSDIRREAIPALKVIAGWREASLRDVGVPPARSRLRGCCKLGELEPLQAGPPSWLCAKSVLGCICLGASN